LLLMPHTADIPDERVSYPARQDDRIDGRSPMAWFVLLVSGLLESVWALALSRSAGFSRLGPSLLFAVALVLSMAGLGYALRTLPLGTAYAVWVGVGVAGTAVAGITLLGETASAARLISLLLVVAGVAGLKLFH
jgi:quaternary ammonium compound-resistance protein SugE